MDEIESNSKVSLNKTVSVAVPITNILSKIVIEIKTEHIN